MEDSDELAARICEIAEDPVNRREREGSADLEHNYTDMSELRTWLSGMGVWKGTLETFFLQLEMPTAET